MNVMYRSAERNGTTGDEGGHGLGPEQDPAADLHFLDELLSPETVQGPGADVQGLGRLVHGVLRGALLSLVELVLSLFHLALSLL